MGSAQRTEDSTFNKLYFDCKIYNHCVYLSEDIFGATAGNKLQRAAGRQQRRGMQRHGADTVPHLINHTARHEPAAPAAPFLRSAYDYFPSMKRALRYAPNSAEAWGISYIYYHLALPITPTAAGYRGKADAPPSRSISCSPWPMRSAQWRRRMAREMGNSPALYHPRENHEGQDQSQAKERNIRSRFSFVHCAPQTAWRCAYSMPIMGLFHHEA